MHAPRRRFLSRGLTPQKSAQQTWRPPLDFRVVFPLIACFMLVGYFYPFTDLESLVADPFGTLLVTCASLYVGIIAFRNRIELHPDALYVWTLTRVRRAPLADIVEVRSSDNGLELKLRDGDVLTTWLIGGKIRPHRERRTRGDRLAGEVRALVLGESQWVTQTH